MKKPGEKRWQWHLWIVFTLIAIVLYSVLAIVRNAEAADVPDWLAGCTQKEVKAIEQALPEAMHYGDEAKRFMRRMRYWEAEQDYPDEACKALRGATMNLQWSWDILNAMPRCSALGDMTGGRPRPVLPEC